MYSSKSITSRINLRRTLNELKAACHGFNEQVGAGMYETIDEKEEARIQQEAARLTSALCWLREKGLRR